MMNSKEQSIYDGIDVVDDAHNTTVNKRKDSILERINKRNKERQNYLGLRLDQRNKDNVQIEGADYFAQEFGERVHAVEAHIKSIRERASDGNADNRTSTGELSRLFINITLEIQDLQRHLTASTIFLTDFKISACQKVINELSTSCEEARFKLLPKKKFGFSSSRKAAPSNSAGVTTNAKVAVESRLDDSPENSRITKSVADNASVFVWTLANRSHAHICMRAEEVDGKDITISNVSHCLIEIQGHAGSVQLSNASDCTILCGPISRSLFAEYCRSCTLAVACQQLRLHSSTAIRIYLHVTCRGIIEDSSQIEIGKYCYDYANFESDFVKAGIDRTVNNYADIADFNWLSPEAHSPNWKLLKDCPAPKWSELRCNFKEEATEKCV